MSKFHARFSRITATFSGDGFKVTLNYKLDEDTAQLHRIVQYHEYLDEAILAAYSRWLKTKAMYDEMDSNKESVRQMRIEDFLGDALASPAMSTLPPRDRRGVYL